MSQFQKMWAAICKARWWIAGVACVVVLSWLAIPSSSTKSPAPFDLDGTSGNDTKAFRLLVERFGGSVKADSMPQGRVGVLFRDDLTQAETDRVEKWISDGGTLIAATPNTSFVKARQESPPIIESNRLSPKCNLREGQDVKEIQMADDSAYATFKADASHVGCFPEGKGFFLVKETRGKGTLYSLGSPQLFTNKYLDKADNAVLVANLIDLDSKPQITMLHSTSLYDQAPARKTLRDLISPHVGIAILQLLLAGVLFMMWRGRRLGHPVDEEPLVALPASQLVVAVGDLMQTAHHTAAGAAALRADARQNITKLLGLSPDTDPRTIAEFASRRVGIDRDAMFAALSDAPVVGDKNLIKLSQDIEKLQREVANAK